MSDEQRLLSRMEWIAGFLDEGFTIPGTEVHLGADVIIGLIPGLGDAFTGMLALYIVWGAWRLGVPVRALTKMTGNLAIDMMIGAIPLVGDAFDVYWRSSRWNMDIVHEHLRLEEPVTA